MTNDTVFSAAPTSIYRARYILDGLDWVEHGYLGVDDDRIVGIDESLDGFDDVGPGAEVIDLGEVAVVPGLVNAHSHAFQRGIRGQTEYIDNAHRGQDFWTWRRAMYRAALGFDAERVESVAKLAFLEMALSGITTVGEFHYLHHRPDGQPYGDPNELANRVISAARRVGIRIALLRVGYQRAGYQRPAEPAQRRFVEPDVETYLERAALLDQGWADDRQVSVGLAPHSIRAVPGPWLSRTAQYAADHDMALHIHACEQRREIAESRAEYGRPPVAVFDELGMLDDRLTLVHGTHLSAQELELIADRRPTICGCPTTERNLGDGFLPASDLVGRDVPISLGSDSHTTIDLWEEMRLVEYHERLRAEQRNVLAAAQPVGRSATTAAVVWPMGTEHGARALGLRAGRLKAGHLADFVAVDLDHITLRGACADTLLAHMTLSMPAAAVVDVVVGGRRIVDGGQPVCG